MSMLTSWFIRNPVAANLIMLLILVMGYMTVNGMRIEGFPKLPADTIIIDTTYYGAYTEQVDEQITQKVEDALEGLNGIKTIKSFSYNNGSQVRVEKNAGHDLQRLLDDIRLRIDGVATLPSDAERPKISLNDFDFPALYVMLDGEIDQKTLQQLAKTLKENLLEQPEISKLRLLGEKQPEMRIGTNPDELERYGLTISDVAAAIKKSSLLSTAGMLKTKGANISLRADSQAYYKADFENIPVIENGDGTRILLRDIAMVEDQYQDDDVIVRFDGKPAIGMEVLIGRKENVLHIADVAKRVIADFESQLPPEMSVSMFGDSSSYISDRLSLLRTSAIQGLLLVVFLLALFLHTKLALWVGMGIPICIAGALAVMGTSWIDYSLNDITTFGLIIALGILVDDAVVVGESVFTERRRHKDPIVGTEQGVKKVATATVFGVLTTIAAFLPMMLIQEGFGTVLSAFSGVVILALLFSLFESKFILPAHLAYVDIDKKPSTFVVARLWSQCQHFAQTTLSRFRDSIYAPALNWAIRQRYAMLITFVSVALLGMGLIENGKIKSIFFPDVPGQIIRVTMEMDPRAPYSMTIGNMEKIEKIGNEINDFYIQKGVTEAAPINHMLKVVAGAFQGEIYAELLPSESRKNLNTSDIVNLWRERVGELEGTINLKFSASDEGTSGGLELYLFGKNEAILKEASNELMQELNAIQGVYNLRDSIKGGQPEVRLLLKPEATHLGFSAQDLAFEIGGRFTGIEAQRMQRSGEEVKVYVSNNKESSRTLEDLMQTRVRSQNGEWYSLLSIAEISSSYASDYIERRNGKRVNNVQAQVDEGIVSNTEVGQQITEVIVPKLKGMFPTINVVVGGELQEAQALSGSLSRALIVISVLIYVLLAIPLKSYFQPFIIMAVVPFGFIGAAAGHLIMDVPLSLLSFFGMLALTGIIVNDSLVMMTRFNHERANGLDISAALISSGVGRFQAIFLTTVTTVAGLIPLMSETSEQAQYLIPAAISLAYGEIFGTAITLILIPVLIAIAEDAKAVIKKPVRVNDASA
ncbi:efflux RND transporter permease subunit [Pseudoalteromonas aurantia]|uniref:Uncharacterized protein n=1 Tax=Pseudoalteromonas aurantia 208 TaxID=1314867 RepID=A0ABR9E9X2_9GAMM|nr:efflux RND transporter permease subunit [Pseudoalteromonas aurantia]MBE0367786.1 hypothetical protein [Pseudoalteromonas aurantia 208]